MFNHAKIAGFGESMVHYTHQRWLRWRDEEQIDLAHEMSALTLQIVAKTLFDADVDSDTDHVSMTVTAGMRLVNNAFGPRPPCGCQPRTTAALGQSARIWIKS